MEPQRDAAEGPIPSSASVEHGAQAGPFPGWNYFHWIMVALLLWGGYLAIGAVRGGALKGGGNYPSLRGLIVFGCVLAFLGFWLAALAVRQRRLKREAAEDAAEND